MVVIVNLLPRNFHARKIALSRKIKDIKAITGKSKNKFPHRSGGPKRSLLLIKMTPAIKAKTIIEIDIVISFDLVGRNTPDLHLLSLALKTPFIFSPDESLWVYHLPYNSL
jgi:hypothetical protein